jgi:hypothetical protein
MVQMLKLPILNILVKLILSSTLELSIISDTSVERLSNVHTPFKESKRSQAELEVGSG